MRRSAAALLLLLALDAAARTVTIEGGITLVVCDDFKLTHYIDHVLVMTCPTSNKKFKMTITDCSAPRIETISAGNYRLVC